MNSQVARNVKWVGMAVLIALFLGGCKGINQFLVKPMLKPSADSVTLLSEAHVVPYLLTTDDTTIGCAGSESTTNLIMALGRVTEEPHELAVMLHLGSGGCEQRRAFEKEMEYLKYIRAQQPDMAQDALFAQKIHHGKAAKRYYTAWKQLILFNDGEEIGDGCPDHLDQTFDELVWLAGLLAGLSAMLQDTQSGVGIGVPKNIPKKVERAVGCLDNNKWFGIPMALKAAIWLLLPGAMPEGEDGWSRLEQADLIGEHAGVRVPHLLHVVAANAKGDMERVRKVIKRHAEHIEEHESNAQFRMFDTIATAGIQQISDRMWVEAMGHRTPVGQLGSFWDENAADDIESVDLDDLF